MRRIGPIFLNLRHHGFRAKDRRMTRKLLHDDRLLNDAGVHRSDFEGAWAQWRTESGNRQGLWTL